MLLSAKTSIVLSCLKSARQAIKAKRIEHRRLHEDKEDLLACLEARKARATNARRKRFSLTQAWVRLGLFHA
jgi:hypothetical protein